MKYRNEVRKFGRKFAAQVSTGLVLAGGATVALADAAAAVAKMESKESDIDLLGWAAVGLAVAVAVFAYVKRAAR
ncbi:hypothetical protein DN824_22095 [Stutzerimonas nosocomialis]|uniref:major capsid protein n=1 Tax=Stutzerimonas nosocomialis TaxID=1056496 RepID=UPI001108EDB1|nr:major capsid protein [Stutzerimonas nosocomialis]TLX52751.1 hypothetical protein DN824_22095 [Stutzerimonas nosocomialis]